MKKLILLLLLLTPHLLKPLSANHLHQFMWANIDTFGNNPERALQRYQKIMPQSIWTYHGYIPFLFDYSKYETIISLADTIDKYFASNAHLQLLLALSFKKVNNHAQGNKRIIALAHKYPTHPNIALRAAQIHVEEKEPRKALIVLDAYLNKSPHKTNSFLFYFLKGQIYAQLKDSPNALESLEKCTYLQPSYSQAWLMRAVLEEQKGNIKNAIAGYSQFLGLTSNMDAKNPLAHHLTKLMMQQSTFDNKKNIFGDYESCFDKAIFLFTKNLFPQALIECTKYLQYHPESIKAKLLKIQIYTAQNNISSAIALLRKEIECNPEGDLWYKTLYHLKQKAAGKGNIEDLFKLYADKYSTSLYAQLYAADTLLRTTRSSQALPYLLKAESLSINDLQKIAILYQQALIFYDTKELENGMIALNKITSLDAYNAPAQNLLAYIAAKQKQFDLAHAAIEKTLTAEPNNPHYLDTKGYIFYKEKNYTQAQKIFAPIALEHKNDTRILSHLKKTYTKQNKSAKTGATPVLQAHNIMKK